MEGNSSTGDIVAVTGEKDNETTRKKDKSLVVEKKRAVLPSDLVSNFLVMLCGCLQYNGQGVVDASEKLGYIKTFAQRLQRTCHDLTDVTRSAVTVKDEKDYDSVVASLYATYPSLRAQ